MQRKTKFFPMRPKPKKQMEQLSLTTFKKEVSLSQAHQKCFCGRIEKKDAVVET